MYEALFAQVAVAKEERAVVPIRTIKLAFVAASPKVEMLNAMDVMLPADRPAAVNSAAV